ncbi:MAG: minor capsid protein [Oscillospiraceae bacterium]|nr:minor capsid protein [Oscillospiraceae bacterium]
MNILDKIADILKDDTVKLGYLPDKPDDITAIFEYQGGQPSHSFRHTDFTENIQIRTRGSNSYAKAQEIALILDNYTDKNISIIQITSVFDIGRDSHERQEYTVNFKIYRR